MIMLYTLGIVCMITIYICGGNYDTVYAYKEVYSVWFNLMKSKVNLNDKVYDIRTHNLFIVCQGSKYLCRI